MNDHYPRDPVRQARTTTDCIATIEHMEGLIDQATAKIEYVIEALRHEQRVKHMTVERVERILFAAGDLERAKKRK